MLYTFHLARLCFIYLYTKGLFRQWSAYRLVMYKICLPRPFPQVPVKIYISFPTAELNVIWYQDALDFLSFFFNPNVLGKEQRVSVGTSSSYKCHFQSFSYLWRSLVGSDRKHWQCNLNPRQEFIKCGIAQVHDYCHQLFFLVYRLASQ